MERGEECTGQRGGRTPTYYSEDGVGSRGTNGPPPSICLPLIVVVTRRYGAGVEYMGL